MSNVLLIGGNGFIGRHLSSLLVSLGYDVTILTRAPVHALDTVAGVHYETGDFRDLPIISKLVSRHEYIVHLAYDSLNLTEHNDIVTEFDRNVRPVEQLAAACLASNVQKLVIVSSGGTVYGNARNESPIAETSSTDPISLYGTSKLMIERVAMLAFHRKGLPVCIVRPANAYGPGQTPFKGQGLVATALGCAYTGRKMMMFGAGETVRDYVHVEDVARSIGAVLQSGISGEIYNIGTGAGTSINRLIHDYVAPLTARSGFEIKVSTEPARGVDVNYNVLSPEKLRVIDPIIPVPLAEGLVNTWEWVMSTLGTEK
jgi:UDP-glucose 4-epimerase